MDSHTAEPKAHYEDLSFLWLEITPRCNLECIHCYADSAPQRPLYGELTTEEWCAVLAEAASLGCRQVQFIGGEPTLHPHLADMVSFAASRGYTFIEVFTNATRIDERLLKLFKDKCVHVAVSFYSDDPDVHDSITRSAGSFKRTVSNLRRLVSASVPIRAAVIETHENFGHTESARTFLQMIGITNIGSDLSRAVGRGAAKLASPEPFASLCGECWKGKLCVTSSGDIFPCVFSRFAEVGHAQDGVEATLKGVPLSDFRLTFRAYCESRRHKSPTVMRHESCNPTCSPCSPDAFIECAPGGTRCQPATSCAPSLSKCSPSVTSPCGPDRSCGPTCAPSRSCGPSE